MNQDAKKAYQRAYYEANKEKILAREKARYAANCEAKRAYAKVYRKENREKANKWNAHWRATNPEKARESVRKCKDKNRDAINYAGRLHHKAAGEARLKQKREWAAANRDKGAVYAVQRRRGVKQATPTWADKGLMDDLYRYAKIMRVSTGIKCEVDHIVPIAGADVCGLHSHDNLTVLTKAANRSKWNRHWPDMP